MAATAKCRKLGGLERKFILLHFGKLEVQSVDRAMLLLKPLGKDPSLSLFQPLVAPVFLGHLFLCPHHHTKEESSPCVSLCLLVVLL